MTQTDRHLSLDAIRGFAVMGILLLNIVGFAMPDAGYVNPAAWGGTDPLNAGVWAVNFVLFDGKMRGLFSVLFGASMLLVMQRAEAAGQNARSVHLNRMAWLFVIGAAHFILLWWGDILVPYAICGTLARSAFRRAFRRWPSCSARSHRRSSCITSSTACAAATASALAA